MNNSQLTSVGIQYPMKFNPDRFGYQHLDQVTPHTIHTGIDLNGGDNAYSDMGANVHSIADGIVVYANQKFLWGKGWGKMVVIYHGKYKRWSRYAHLNDLTVVENEIVEKGRIIGHVGQTGNARGPHLHFDIIKKRISWTSYTYFRSREYVINTYEDPLKWLDHQIIQEEKLIRPPMFKFPDWPLMKEAIAFNKTCNPRIISVINSEQRARELLIQFKTILNLIKKKAIVAPQDILDLNIPGISDHSFMNTNGNTEKLSKKVKKVKKVKKTKKIKKPIDTTIINNFLKT